MAQGRQFIQAGWKAYGEHATNRSLNAQPVRAVRQLQHGPAGSLKVHCPQKILDNSWASERHQRDMGLQRTMSIQRTMRPHLDMCLHWDMCLQPALCSSLRVLSHYGSACQSSPGRAQHNSRVRVQQGAAGALSSPCVVSSGCSVGKEPRCPVLPCSHGPALLTWCLLLRTVISMWTQVYGQHLLMGRTGSGGKHG